ncbi:AAA family ATPase [Desulfovibrio litoralis]|uniref:Wobble nucleotide-excising tRNase n=1 Tax=Desulfovibrio litoralis DSM 11393 TaxID=1121455 RepID=A0A1M7SZF5_9BACT|nr:AAA family ATPase [Desulfovibrio litoralis]SHN63850.1 Wobble nucleotide-excising tRNase [Desulfovibrio litoralis DSM 11393]
MGIKKIQTIKKFGIFKDFIWDKSFIDDKNITEFKNINIFYGRNYSGKTSLSRIFRAIETKALSDKIKQPYFSILCNDGSTITQENFRSSNKIIRVFNEDFVRENLHFITNPNADIEPFAILGADNNIIEQTIQKLEEELGSNKQGEETGLYDNALKSEKYLNKAIQEYDKHKKSFDKQLSDKATNQGTGIKYNSKRFGDQNYTVVKLNNDIRKVLSENYQQPTKDKINEYEKIINDSKLDSISINIDLKSFNFQSLSTKVEELVTKEISESDKIEELVKDAILNRWVSEGRKLHKDVSKPCAFCGNNISENRWLQLEKHFDEETEKLENNINQLLNEIRGAQSSIQKFSFDKTKFYSQFHKEFDEAKLKIEEVTKQYKNSIEQLMLRLEDRKKDIIHHKTFDSITDYTQDMVTEWNSFKNIIESSNSFTNSLEKIQNEAKEQLRLNEVYNFTNTINYTERCETQKRLDTEKTDAEKKHNDIKNQIKEKLKQIEDEKRKLHDESQGAVKVNEYLKNFFGHNYLSIEAIDDPSSTGTKIKFQVVRGGEKAYNLSEGECNLLAFCYFVAKLQDVATNGQKPIIWIDDPVSSLDGNHIFFVYSILNAEIVDKGEFKQLFISTHNLDFLKYLKRLNGKFTNNNNKQQPYEKKCFVINRSFDSSTINPMPKYLQEYATEFNYLFHTIYQFAQIDKINDNNYQMAYNFPNNARKFLEIYLYYKYPDGSDDKNANDRRLRSFLNDDIVYDCINRITNEYSHLCGCLERGTFPIEVPEMNAVAKKIIDKLKVDKEQYEAFCNSVNVTP